MLRRFDHRTAKPFDRAADRLRHATLGHERNHSRHAQFRRLFHEPTLPISFRHRDAKHQSHRRFAIDLAPAGDAQDNCCSLGPLDRGIKFRPAAVEKHDGHARLGPQDMQQMMRFGSVQADFANGQRRRAIKSIRQRSPEITIWRHHCSAGVLACVAFVVQASSPALCSRGRPHHNYVLDTARLAVCNNKKRLPAGHRGPRTTNGGSRGTPSRSQKHLMISPAPRFRFSLRPAVFARRGLSVVELLAATVISLIVMGATVQLFGTVGSQITNGRSNIEAGDRLRTALERLRKDLRGITVDMTAWNRPESASGYFEIIKGPASTWDKSAATPSNPGSLLGYTSDMLFFTTRTRDVPFVGRVISTNGSGTTVESQVAEVAWFLVKTNLNAANPAAPAQATSPVTYTLYRRQLLVLPGVGTTIATGSPPSISSTTYNDKTAGTQFDLSAHLVSNANGNLMVLNSLADLEYRENRFSHSQSFPYLASAPQPFPYAAPTNTGASTRYGEDVVLTNVLSFDVKVWDPGAPVFQDSSTDPTPLVPSDVGYPKNPAAPVPPITKIGNGVYGAYVDLNWNNGTALTNPTGAPQSFFSGPYYGSNAVNSWLSASKLGYGVYDTWAAGYEAWYNGTPSSGQFGQSFNGFQDVSGGAGVDGPSEKITSPPYPVPLRGIQIKIRIYEPSSKQVREATIQESFVPN